jgi:hypothetical protein
MLVTMIGMVSYTTIAQTGRTTFGITGGMHLSNINGRNAVGDDLDNQMKTGFTGGINVAIPLSNGFYVQPGVEYRQKGTEFRNGDKLTINYIDIPVNFVYKPALGNGAMILGFGPYVGFGIGGKMKSADGTKRELKFNNNYSVSDAQDIQFKKMDAGANLIAGYEFSSKVSAMIKAQLGLVNVNPKTDIPNDKTRYRNTGFGLSLGYRL